MLINIKQIYGRKLAALDGLIGHVSDFFFDDNAWVLRYMVANTGSWLTGRLVLLSPHALGAFDQSGKTLHVSLHIKQIANSPPIGAHQPVSRKFEEDFHSYYGWPAYWQGPQIWGMSSYPIVVPPPELPIENAGRARQDIRLRSTKAVNGCLIEAVDGTIGKISGLMLDDKSWAIRNLVVETGSWLPGKEILISLSDINRISYEDSKVYVKIAKADILRKEDEELAKGAAEHFLTEDPNHQRGEHYESYRSTAQHGSESLARQHHA